MTRSFTNLTNQTLLIRMLMLVGFISLNILHVPLVGAQEEASAAVEMVEILDLNAESFPTITITYVARDAQGNGLSQTDGVFLRENGTAIDEFDALKIDEGIDITFVIDANRSIAGIDLIGDFPRVAKVRQAIDQYADLNMSRTEKDRVSIIVPDGPAASFLLENESTPAGVKDAISRYNPQELPQAAPIQSMLELAFEQAAVREPTNRYQAIVLFSDTEFLADQVNYFALRDIQAQSDAVFFGAILGKVASPSEINNMAELYIPSGGYHVHMPEPENMTPIFNTVQSNSSRQELRYRSLVNEGGSQSVEFGFGDLSLTQQFDVETSAPVLTILSGSDPIVRTGQPETAIGDFDPASTIVTAQLIWTDGFPRRLNEVRFYVDGVEQALTDPAVLDPNSLLSFPWNIANLESGSYEIEIRVEDELGLTGTSGPVLQQIDAQVSFEEPTATPEPLPTATPPPEVQRQEALDRTIDSLLTEQNLSYALYGVIALAALILLFRWRRRSAETQPDPEPIFEPDAIRPENVYLEVERSSPTDRTLDDLMPMQGNSATIGSDPFRADLIIDDESISRLHARITWENGRFVLYDEGSAYGTRVNFERIGLSPLVIKDGDELEFGSVNVRFRVFGSDVAALAKLATEIEDGTAGIAPPPPDEGNEIDES